MDETEGRWADLPEELLEILFKNLVGIDNLRVRAVCTSWRSVIPLSKKLNFQSYILPYPVNPADYRLSITGPTYFGLTESTVFCVHSNGENLDSSSRTSAFSRNCWLVKVEQLGQGKFRILDPLSEREIHPERYVEVINLIGSRVTEICKAYNLKFVNPSLRIRTAFIQKYAKKVVVSPPTSNSSSCEAAAIDICGHLWHAKSGDKSWTQLSEGNSSFVDLISCNKDGFYATEKKGKTVMFDWSFKETAISSSVDSDGTSKYLVNSPETGELFLIDIILDTDRRRYVGSHNDPREPVHSTAMELKIYKLNEKKQQWEEVKSLEDRAVFAGEDCSYIISNLKASGFKDNCVYFTDRNYFKPVEDDDDELTEVLLGHNIGVFDLRSGRLGPLASFREFAAPFWPPPDWITGKTM